MRLAKLIISLRLMLEMMGLNLSSVVNLIMYIQSSVVDFKTLFMCTNPLKLVVYEFFYLRYNAKERVTQDITLSHRYITKMCRCNPNNTQRNQCELIKIHSKSMMGNYSCHNAIFGLSDNFKLINFKILF